MVVEDNRTETADHRRTGNARRWPSSTGAPVAVTAAPPAVVTTPPVVVVPPSSSSSPQYRAAQQQEYQWVQRAARAAAQQHHHAAATAAAGSRRRPWEVDRTPTLTALGTSMRHRSSPYIDTSAMMGDPTVRLPLFLYRNQQRVILPIVVPNVPLPFFSSYVLSCFVFVLSYFFFLCLDDGC